MGTSTSIVTATIDESGNVVSLVDQNGNSIAAANLPVAPQAITANRVLTAADNGRTFYNSTANAYTVTLPAALPSGFGIKLVQKSTGTLTPVAGANVTVSSKEGYTKTGGANSTITVSNSGVVNDYLINGQGVA